MNDVTEYQMSVMLHSIMGGLPPKRDSYPEDMILAVGGWDIPVSPRLTRICYTPSNVFNDILRPTPQKPLVKFYDETEDMAIIVKDCMGVGKDALLIMTEIDEETNTMEDWWSGMKHSRTVVAGSWKDRTFAAFTLKSFF